MHLEIIDRHLKVASAILTSLTHAPTGNANDPLISKYDHAH
jgi:hypothetical protein